jgi:hypothetical protein
VPNKIPQHHAALQKTSTIMAKTPEEIFKETDHFFTESESHKGSTSGPECFLLNEELHQLYLQLDKATTLAQEKQIALMIRAVVSRLQALGCSVLLQP